MANKIFIESEKELAGIASKIKTRLIPGSVLGLVGELGSGKTTFVKYLAKEIGLEEIIKSPTYTFLKSYTLPSGAKLHHIDAYRIKSSQDLLSVGIGDIIDNDSITIVEWADRAKDILPKNTAWMEIRYSKHGREIIDYGFDY